MTDCIFCQIVNQEVPSSKVYEDEDTYAFLDLSQTTRGHTLLVPKKHVTDIFEYDEDLARMVFSNLPKIARALEKTFPEMKGLNIINNNKELAYQSVFHSHIHFLPRFIKDDFQIKFCDHGQEYSKEDLNKMAEDIAFNLNEGHSH
jgi:histidine triad (HIT) family protein